MNTGYDEHIERVGSRRLALAEDLRACFPTETRLTLEIGCGHGHWLVDYGARIPDVNCLGIDVIGDRIARAMKKRDRAGRTNVQFVKAEAVELLDALPPWVTLGAIFILFPDPWPKKRHWKKRLVNDAFLARLAERCAPGARCHFRTDDRGYFDWVLERLDNQGLWQRDEERAWPFERETVFQARAAEFQSLIMVRL